MISSVRKVAKILDCFKEDGPALGNKEIAEKLGMKPSSVHHLISTLCQEGILIQDGNKKYRLGWKLLEWSNHVMYHQDIYDDAMPFIGELVRKFNATAHIGMFHKGDVRFILKMASPNAPYVPTYVGANIPAYCTSTGKVLLAFNPSFIKPTISKGLVKRSVNTITCINTLQKELEMIRKNGYAISNNENEHGLYAVAAPIRSYNGQVVAALNLVSLTSYMTGHNHEIIIQSVMKTAQLISKELGYILA
jgi:IclR family transcriptional regulator, KDG regulon repressor